MMTIIGILAVTAIPRCFSQPTFDARGFQDQAASALRYARTVAVASGCAVTFTRTGNSFALAHPASGGACTATVLNGPTGVPFTATAAVDVTFSGAAAVTFNPDGTASANANFTVQGGGFNPGGTPSITVIAATGYVQ